VAIFCSTSRMSPSLSHSGERQTSLLRVGAMLPPTPVWLALVSAINNLFVPTVHTSHIQSPYNYFTSLNTSTHVSIMGARHEIHIYTHTQFTVSLLVLLLDRLTGQLAPNSHVRNSNWYIYYVECKNTYLNHAFPQARTRISDTCTS
jgi:hypothetical protein